MRVNVLFFGMLKDVAGRSQETLEVDPGTRLGELFESYANACPRLSELKSSIVLARNREFARPAELLAEGDEVAFLPPVSGGSGTYTHEVVTEPEGHFFALTRLAIDTRQLVSRMQRGEDGAVVTFEGVVRNNTGGRATRYLEYECYEAMAIKTIAGIGCEIAGSYDVGRIAIVHRLGRMEIGETSVAIVVGAPHRRPAFNAALEAIDRVKKLVPIWKKEHFADGEAWVEGEWDVSVRPS